MFEAVAADLGKAAQRKIRCAVYTRKSTEEGLEQDFNSLQAHGKPARPVASQRHEGWVLLPWDDGGSQEPHNRPAVQQLLADIDAGRLTDCVYKVDRKPALDRFFKIGRAGCPGLLCIGDPIVQYGHVNGPANLEHAAVVCPV